MMTTPKFGFASVGLAACLVLGGCGETELNGKIFDVMGISASAQAASKKEPKMAARSGLVLPPDQSRLPEPGTAVDEGNAALAAVDDPDQRKALAAAERARLHKAYCSGQLNWKERVADKDAQAKSPYGPCGLVGDALKSQ
jgi:hypothetical protein